MTGGEQWTAGTLALVKRVIADDESLTFEDEANAILTALADAGLLVQPGGETAGITAKRCDYTDRDLSTNGRLRCDKAAGHTTHRLVWDAGDDSDGKAHLRPLAATQSDQEAPNGLGDERAPEASTEGA